LTALPNCGILTARPGGTGAAESAEPCQVREEAAVRWSLWAPPENLLGRIFLIYTGISPHDNPSRL